MSKNPAVNNATMKYYTCGKHGHKSNQRPARKPVNLAGLEDDVVDDEEEIEQNDDFYQGVEFAEEQEEGEEHINCVVQRLLYSSKDQYQCNNIFQS